jgi:alanine racemase
MTPSAIPAHAADAHVTWIEIDRASLRANLGAFRTRLGTGVELAHVVKSNAYGHGLELVARADEASGLVDRLAVISVEELHRIRRAGVRLPVLLLGYVPRHAWDAVVEAEGSPTVFDRESLHALSRAAERRGREVGVHVKLETGTHRYGVAEDELLDVARLAATLPGLRLEGLTTHFANIEDTTDHRRRTSGSPASGSRPMGSGRAGRPGSPRPTSRAPRWSFGPCSPGRPGWRR